MKALLTIEWIQTKRNLIVFAFVIGMPCLFFLLFSTLFMETIPNPLIKERAIRDYLLTMTAFSMSGSGFFTFPSLLKEDLINKWTKWIKHSPVPMWQYYVAKLLRMIIYFMLTIAFTLAFGMIVKGVHLTVEQFLGASVFLLIGGMMYLCIGILIAQIPSLQVMTIIGNIAYFVGAIFGGSWMPVSLFPQWMKSVANWMPTYHANQIVTHYISETSVKWMSMIWVIGYAIVSLSIALIIQKRSEVR